MIKMQEEKKEIHILLKVELFMMESGSEIKEMD
jgi:hypothetical protein